MRPRTILAALCSALVLGVAHAALVTGNVGRVTSFYTFSDFGNGDVVLSVQNPLPTCQDGFWVRMTDPGAKVLTAQLLAAFHAGTELQVWGYDHELWAGSSGRFCRLNVARSLVP
jgi:hypothetical protein